MSLSTFWFSIFSGFNVFCVFKILKILHYLYHFLVLKHFQEFLELYFKGSRVVPFCSIGIIAPNKTWLHVVAGRSLCENLLIISLAVAKLQVEGLKILPPPSPYSSVTATNKGNSLNRVNRGSINCVRSSVILCEEG